MFRLNQLGCLAKALNVEEILNVAEVLYVGKALNVEEVLNVAEALYIGETQHIVKADCVVVIDRIVKADSFAGV